MPEEQKLDVLDMLVGINPHVGDDGIPKYEKLSVLSKQQHLFLLITATLGDVNVLANEQRFNPTIHHNATKLEQLEAFFKVNFAHLEKARVAELRARKKEGGDLALPGSVEFNRTRQELINKARRKRRK